MLKIRRTANGDVVFTVSGRLDADNISELSSTTVADRETLRQDFECRS